MLGWSAPEHSGVLYIDGHVRVYDGGQTQLPHHYVARQRLCRRATTDYWVNAMDGQHFVVVNQAVDPGLIQVVEKLCAEINATETIFPCRFDTHRCPRGNRRPNRRRPGGMPYRES